MRLSDLVRQYQGPAEPLQDRCGHPDCLKSGAACVVRCECKLILYCSKSHRREHYQHRSFHETAMKAKAKVRYERDQLLAADSKLFKTHKGNFWIVKETQKYTLACHDLTQRVYLTAGTPAGLKKAIDTIKHIVGLCTSALSTRELPTFLVNHYSIPPLRLGLDRSAYTAIKAVCYLNFIYFHPDWAAADDIFESPDEFIKYPDELLDPTGDPALVVLLKLKVLVDIRNLRVARKVLPSSLPREVRQMIESAVLDSDLSDGLAGEPPESLAKKEALLIEHVELLGRAIIDVNPDFMGNFFDPYFALADDPVAEGYNRYGEDGYPWSKTPCDPSDDEDENRPRCKHADAPFTQREFSENTAYASKKIYVTFLESPAVTRLLDDAREISRLCESESRTAELNEAVAKMPRGVKYMNGRHPTDVRLWGVWQAVEFAIQDAAFLGPREQRPSLKEVEKYRPL
ncbi:hypothetical protein F5X68DRAFT_194418 [Plectosphaerella plurivora]|uniref:MYND-type domain-containing protein n=1 Tax=Plectosphaerella plurivora TaxID=936078 RepID=A0A9P8V449_9PEZI|nr:hypothetical protein F5X68DRAFT_194418 [Plectosphaerella plurivora]